MFCSYFLRVLIKNNHQTIKSKQFSWFFLDEVDKVDRVDCFYGRGGLRYSQ
jgi:hypothetical protein